MQSTDTGARTAGALTHPETAAWMSYLYGELPDPAKRELAAHLAQCPACAAQVKTWRDGMKALDAWSLPAPRAARPAFVPALKWAAAAAVLLALGGFLGRQSARNSAEIAALRSSVANLQNLARHPDPSGLTNSIAAANSETLRLLTEYSRQHQTERDDDQKALNLTLRTFDDRINRLRTELETVAVNTETGFQQTHQVLASFTAQPQRNN